MTDPLSLIGKDWRKPDGVIHVWLAHGTVSRSGTYRGLMKHGTFRLNLSQRRLVQGARIHQRISGRPYAAPPRPPAPRLTRFRRWCGICWRGVGNWALDGLVRPIPFTWDD